MNDVLDDVFAGVERLLILGRGPSATEEWARGLKRENVLITDPTYATRDVFDGEPFALLIGDRSCHLEKVAERYLATEIAQKPVLLHAYLPDVPPTDCVALGLPNPLPILPLLKRTGLYVHQPGEPYPTSGMFLILLAVALGKRVSFAGIDLYQHSSGRTYAGDTCDSPSFVLPPCHSRELELEHLRLAVSRSPYPLIMPPAIAACLKAP